MQVRRYVLIVDAPSGAVAQGAGELQQLGYDVALARDLASALAAVASLERLSLVVVNCHTNLGGYGEFMAAIRGLHPNLPVVWLGDTGNVLARFLKPPTATRPEPDIQALKLEATNLLKQRFYSNELAGSLVQAAEGVLREFGVETQRSDPYIQSNLSTLSDVNALLSFCGEGLSGHLILSTSADHARELHDKLAAGVRDPGYDDLEDLLGEVTNRVMGAIKRVFAARSLSFALRTPAFIRGANASFRSKGAPPSLAVEFADEQRLLRLEFCMDQMGSEPPPPAEGVQFFEAGTINFL